MYIHGFVMKLEKQVISQTLTIFRKIWFYYYWFIIGKCWNWLFYILWLLNC